MIVVSGLSLYCSSSTATCSDKW